MIALYRYLLANLLHRQTYLPPLLLFAVVAVGSRGDGGPLLPLYGLWTGAMLICAAWLTMVVLGAEDPVQERITVVNSSRRWLPLVAAVLVVMTFVAVMTGWGLAFPLLVGVAPAGPAGFAVGLAAQLAAAFAGLVVGMFCSRLLIPRPGYAGLTAAGLLLALLLIRGLPPVNLLIRLLAAGHPPGSIVGEVAAVAVVTLVVLAGSLPVVHRLRRIG